MSEELAIIKNVKFGVDDRGRVSLRFDAMQDGGSGALQVIPMPDDYERVIKDAGVSDVNKLEGRACIVEKSRTGGTMMFTRMAKV